MTKTEEAILFAVRAHAGTTRKGKDRPYILHPLEALTIVASRPTRGHTTAAAAARP